MRAPTKENTLVLIAMDIGGKNTQEEDQIRAWAAPTAGPETSTVLEGVLGWGGLWLPVREGCWQQRLKKNIYYSYILTCSVVSFGFFFSFFFPFFFSPMLILLALWNLIKLLRFLFFFFFNHTFYCCYKCLLLCWPFAVVWSFPFFSSFSIFKYFKSTIIFLHLFPSLLSYSYLPLEVNL